MTRTSSENFKMQILKKVKKNRKMMKMNLLIFKQQMLSNPLNRNNSKIMRKKMKVLLIFQMLLVNSNNRNQINGMHFKMYQDHRSLLCLNNKRIIAFSMKSKFLNKIINLYNNLKIYSVDQLSHNQKKKRSIISTYLIYQKIMILLLYKTRLTNKVK